MELLRDTLQTNEIALDDGVPELDPFQQTTGVAQGDHLSPLLFSMVISDLPGQINMLHPLVNLLLSADELVLFTTSRHHLQQALSTLKAYVDEPGLEVNMRMTEAMKFRRGGQLAVTNKYTLAQQQGNPICPSGRISLSLHARHEDAMLTINYYNRLTTRLSCH